MTRGELVTVVVSGDYGKPRPALIVQADEFADLPSVTVLPMTSDLRDAPLLRVTIEAAAVGGLARRSQVMIDKAMTVPLAKVGSRIGALDPGAMAAVTRALAAFLGMP
ncbi:MAG: type II toxin-antitoxin system PemK/MazF family toxin [Caulobacteraceae bacterium]